MARSSIPTSIVVAAEWPDSAFSFLSWWPPRTEPCKNPRLLGRRRYVAYDEDDDDDDNGGDYVFLYGGSVCMSVESRHLLNRTNTELQKWKWVLRPRSLIVVCESSAAKTHLFWMFPLVFDQFHDQRFQVGQPLPPTTASVCETVAACFKHAT